MRPRKTASPKIPLVPATGRRRGFSAAELQHHLEQRTRDGRIWVESILSQGSTFHMKVPVRTDFQKPIQ